MIDAYTDDCNLQPGKTTITDIIDEIPRVESETSYLPDLIKL